MYYVSGHCFASQSMGERVIKVRVIGNDVNL